MPEIVVSNTTPIISLLGIQQFEVLQMLYTQIVVPEAVVREIESGKDKDTYINLKKLNWVTVHQVKDKLLLNHLLNDLDEGEAEVIVSAQELNAKLLIIDEKLARNYAHLKGFVCVGTLGVLLKAKEKGHITAIKPLLIKMQANGIWLSETLIKQILNEANEL